MKTRYKTKRQFNATTAAALLRNRQAGASLVEYAFIFIIFMSVLLGICAFGHMLYVYHYVNHAAKEATRYASVRGSTCATDADGGSCQASNSASGNAGPATMADIQTYISNMVFAGVDSSKLTVPTDAAYLCGLADSQVCNPVIPAALTATACNTAATSNQPKCTVKVTVAYAYNFIFPLLPGTTATSAPCTSAGYCLKSTSEMTIVH
jgi:Flp pilus assembly protein TadG